VSRLLQKFDNRDTPLAEGYEKYDMCSLFSNGMVGKGDAFS
jgi:hypothetical protein